VAALARRVHVLGAHVKTDDGQTLQDALHEAFAWFLGAEAGGWEYELPTADGLRRGIEQWVEKATSAKGVWKSQAAAIRALVLHSASPQEARQAAQAAFSARQGKTRVRGNPDSRFFIPLSRLRYSSQPGGSAAEAANIRGGVSSLGRGYSRWRGLLCWAGMFQS